MKTQGLPWWSTDEKFNFQRKGRGFDPWWGNKIPHAMGQLSPCATGINRGACTLQGGPSTATEQQQQKSPNWGTVLNLHRDILQ